MSPRQTAMLLVALFPALLSAQPSVLLEACNSIGDATKRLDCLKAAAGLPQQSASHEGVVKAFLGLHGMLESGMSLRSYEVAVQDVARELAIFKNSAPSVDPAVIESLETALQTYADAGKFWARSIEFYSRRGNDLAYAGGLPVDMVGLGWMVGRYGLPTRNSDIWGINVGVPVEQGRSHMWRKAAGQARAAIDILKDPPPPPPKASASPNR